MADFFQHIFSCSIYTNKNHLSYLNLFKYTYNIIVKNPKSTPSKVKFGNDVAIIWFGVCLLINTKSWRYWKKENTNLNCQRDAHIYVSLRAEESI